MSSKRNLGIAAGVVILAVAGIAIAGELNEQKENQLIGKHTEKNIALNQVPQTAMAAAQGKLTSISKAEEATTKDGRTFYEIKGKNSAGKTAELLVSSEGQVLGTED